MDRTADFRHLLTAAAAAVSRIHEPAAAAMVVSLDMAPAKLPPSTGFMSSAMELRETLWEVRRDAQADYASAIQACQERMAELERLSKDPDDLGSRAPRRRQHLLEHRQGVVRSLYEDLQELIARVQVTQANEMQHEAEVASYFAAAPRAQAAGSGTVTSALKPPPLPWADTDAYGLRATEPSAPSLPKVDTLRAEGQSLLSVYQTEFDQSQETQKRVQEVSALAIQLGVKVTEQQEVIETIHADVDDSINYTDKAADELKKAKENQNAYGFYVMLWFIGSALFLLVFDFIDARYSWI